MVNLALHLKTSFDHFFNAPVELWNEFVEHCEVIIFKKDDIIKPKGSKENYFYFIERGGMGVFVKNEEATHCLGFAFEGCFGGDYLSILTEQASDLELIALETTKVYRIGVEQFKALSTNPVGQNILKICSEFGYIEKQRHQIDLLTKTGEERYKSLVDRYPKIELRVEQNFIASYLGISLESLRKLRRERSRR